VRARVAWSLGRMPCPGFAEVLQRLASDREPRVRCYALAALADHATELDADPLRKILPTSFASRDKRVRQAAARLATLLPQESWQRLLGLLAQAGPQARLTGAL